MVLLRLLIVSALLTFLGENVLAVVYHVSPLGSDTPPYASYATAAHRVADASRLAVIAGDTLFVHTGDYLLDSSLVLNRGVALVGISRDSTSLNSGYRSTSFFMIRASGDNDISGIHFVGSTGDCVLAIFNPLSGGRMLTHDCRFTNCGNELKHDKPSAFWNNEFDVDNVCAAVESFGDPILWVHHNTFEGTPRPLGIAVQATDGSVVIENNLFDYTGSTIDWIVYLDRFPPVAEVRNNLMIGGGTAVYSFGASALVENNTIIGAQRREGPVYAGIDNADSFVVRNNVFVDCAHLPSFAKVCYFCDCSTCRTGPIHFTHNAFWPPVDSFHAYPSWADPSLVHIFDSANFNARPMFADDSTFRLQYASPLIDAGHPELVDVDGSRADIGWTGGPLGSSYEYVDLPPLPPHGLGVNGEVRSVSIRWSHVREPDLAGYQIYRGSAPGFWGEGWPVLKSIPPTDTSVDDILPDSDDSAFYVITAYDSAGQKSGPSSDLRYVIGEYPGNRPPSFETIPPQFVDAGDTLSLTVRAIDPEGDAVTLSAAIPPHNAAFVDFGGGQGVFAFTPDTSQIGEHDVRFFASDGLLTETLALIVTVEDTSDAVLPLIPQIVRVYPNPINDAAVVEVDIPDVGANPASVEIVAIDVLGRRVSVIYEGQMAPGRGSVTWSLSERIDGVEMASGVYFVVLRVWGHMFGSPHKVAVLR